MKKIYFSLFLLFFGLTATAQAQRRIECKVVGVSDGDTLTCLRDKTKMKIRLLHIDAPEASQPFGKKARQTLAALAFKKRVTLHTDGFDRYRRTLAVVFDDQHRNINLALVQAGMAWAYGGQPLYLNAMERAQRQKIGLWRDKSPIPPVEWRKKYDDKRSDFTRCARISCHRHSSRCSNAGVCAENLQNSAQKRPLAGRLDCTKKRVCRDMPDYATAERYFRQCGWKELDGNGDGIPCNKLYRKSGQNP